MCLQLNLLDAFDFCAKQERWSGVSMKISWQVLSLVIMLAIR
jgi:hypothetical protein